MDLSEDAIADALRRYLPDGTQVRGIHELSKDHGLSNKTYAIDGMDAVLRLRGDGPPVLPLAHDLQGQYAVLNELARRSLRFPVPAVRSMEGDESILGAPFFLMQRLPGQPWEGFEPPAWARGQTPGYGAAITEQMVDLMADLARQPVLETLPVISAADELERWRASVADIASAELLEAYRLLAGCVPQDVDPAPVHGDVRLENILWVDGRISAVLDWELAFNGDPLWDLCWFTLMYDEPLVDGLPPAAIPGFWSRERLIAEWEIRSGRSLRDLAWFQAAAKCRACSVVSTVYSIWKRGLTQDPRMQFYGPHLLRYDREAVAMANIAAARAGRG